MKHEWKKQEKAFYLPKNRPEKVFIPGFKFFTIKGKGNPNEAFFAVYIGVLYLLAYAVKMSPKSGLAPEGYQDYTVYPLEGIWDIEEAAKTFYHGKIDKSTLVFDLMIRQPDFVSPEFAALIIEKTKKKKPHQLLEKVKFESFEEGSCIQMLHIGSYNDEPKSFKEMEIYAAGLKLKRKSLLHREIYLSDARKTAPEKLKTVLRFQLE